MSRKEKKRKEIRMKWYTAVSAVFAFAFASPSFASPTATSTTAAAVECLGATKFDYFGVNESGAEFGNNKIPGTLGTDYTWPSPSSIDVSSFTYLLRILVQNSLTEYTHISTM